MRRRFFATNLEGSTATVAGDHLARVLRAEVGQQYELAHAGRVYLAQIAAVARAEVRFTILEELPQLPAPPGLHLAAALFKFDRFEWMLEKATELGLARLQILATRRTDPRLLAAAPKRLARWHTLVREAAEQSRRADLTELVSPVSLREFLCRPAPPGILLSEDPAAPSLSPGPAPALLLTGPEGGWAPEEFEQIQAAGHRPASLGPRVLRCETAILAALARLG